jgi:hypothetical protein
VCALQRALPPAEDPLRDETLIMGCGALSLIGAHSPENAHAAGEAVAALFALPLVGPVACQALVKLTQEHARNTRRAVHAGAAPAAVAALHEHGARDAMLVRHASRLLNHLAWSDAPAHRAQVVAAGAVEAILAGVRAHPAAADAQSQALRALGNIFQKTTTTRHIFQKSKRMVDARDAALGARVVRAAVEALEAHRGDADTQLYGCHAIWCALESNDDDDDDDAPCGDDARAVRAVLAALRAQPADAMVQRAGCHALECLCDDSAVNQAAAWCAGGERCGCWRCQRRCCVWRHACAAVPGCRSVALQPRAAFAPRGGGGGKG